MEDKKIYTGVVEWFRGAFGFITWEADGEKKPDMFVHFSDINCENFKTLFKGQKVSFEIGENHRGMPKAINVQVIKEQ